MAENAPPLERPQLLEKAVRLDAYLKTIPAGQLEKIMNISPVLARKTQALISQWTVEPSKQRPAIDSFLGDIYSGIQVGQWTRGDREYANRHLRILSGLYGILKPLDGICPYRLELGYKLPKKLYANFYQYWGDSIANTLFSSGPVINLAAVEYSKTVTPFIDADRVVTPVFRTVSPKTGAPVFVTVHAKIARGAFARWLVAKRIDNLDDLKNFTEIGYAYDPSLSTPEAPAFIARAFGGKGLSLRLK